MDQLPSEFDLIIVGTGLIESIISAAASRVGKKVLHIDNSNFYGGIWTSFSLDCVNKVFSSNDAKLQDSSNCLIFGNSYFDISDVKETWHVPEENIDTSNFLHATWTKAKLLNLSRKFNIDIIPKLHFARGDFVELLISSNIARYTEFRSVSRILTWINNKLQVVPCSRNDVFSSNTVTVIEKRMLMKLLNTCLDSNDQDFLGYKQKTFQEYLKDNKLTNNLIHYILYAIARGTDETSCKDGVENVKRFLHSLGRYGKTPFLYSMYGSGEIPQAFCRLSAVFGGIYALSQPLIGLEMKEKGDFRSIICGDQRISADYLVISLDKAPSEFINLVKAPRISRGIFITDRSILDADKEHLTLLLFPPMKGKNSCTIIEMGCLTGTCPKDLYLVHMFTTQSNFPEEDLRHCVETLFDNTETAKSEFTETKPKILWSLYFSMPDTSEIDFQNRVSSNVFICPGPDFDLDYDGSVKQAKDIFTKIYPDSEFLPRAPDPEEIVIGNEDVDNYENEVNKKEEREDVVNLGVAKSI